MDRDREFGEFVDARALVMRRTAYLLCGDWHRAEDIVQTALIKMYVAWSRVRKDSVDAYARKVLVRTAIDETRRGFFQRERIVDAVPESAVTDAASDLDLRRALGALPPGQRAVVVLRYWEDLSITETARILGRTEGTVKSQAAKGLAALRDLLENEPVSRIYASEVIRKGRTQLVRRRTAIAGAMAIVVLAGFGTTAYLASPQKATGNQVSEAAPVLDQNIRLTQILRNANVLPEGVTAEDVGEAKALTFYSKDGTRYAVARLTDALGSGGLTITLSRAAGQEHSCDQVHGNDCRVEYVNGIRVLTYFDRSESDGATAWVASATRPDGTAVLIQSDPFGVFRGDPYRPDTSAPVNRPAPVLGRDALIKIATLPGLTF
ncbi:SigE family RNA polymerase sigma factor [Lentzea albidocapillata]|uniref:RNA polymerase sigma-70 factor, sigma-E family n=1 Tax=Lentzea albidocapillata TaxID=40571 RepID=A0A1W2ECU9_9PSEU|nr:SigE family RNA polymerase sigma factor [Lentzea albidocapillata]SMD07136.1 RNA polymerase sigma-70 factor, sigma-E family [Lentzea albidocapillata]